VAVIVAVIATMAVIVVVIVIVGVSHRVSSRMAESGGIIAFPGDIEVLSG
jgi:hypothetical protein